MPIFLSFLVNLLFVLSSAEAQLLDLPDDSISHFPKMYELKQNQTAIEWDSRLYWLETKSGQKFGLFVMSSHAGMRTGFPYYLNSREDIAVMALTDEHGNKWDAFTKGNLDENFHFSARKPKLNWQMTRSQQGAYLNIETKEVGLQLLSNDIRGKSYYTNYGSDTPGWIDIPGMGKDIPYVDRTKLEVFGHLRLGDETFEVTGSSWMERNWALADTSPFDLMNKRPFAWDWFFLQLELEDEEADLMVFRILDPWTEKVKMTYAAVTLEDGTVRTFNPKHIRIKNGKSYFYGGKKYERSWKLSVPEYHNMSIELDLIPKDPWVGSKLDGLKWGHFDGPCKMKVSYTKDGRELKAKGRAWAEQVNTTWINYTPW